MRVLLLAAVMVFALELTQNRGNCYWVCTPFGIVWHCDERYGPSYPPDRPPPRCEPRRI